MGDPILLAGDHRGVALKGALKERLEAAGHEVRDLGPTGDASVNYPEYAAPAARAVSSESGAERSTPVTSAPRAPQRGLTFIVGLPRRGAAAGRGSVRLVIHRTGRVGLSTGLPGVLPNGLPGGVPPMGPAVAAKMYPGTA